MSNNIDITTNDFDNICRTCLSKEDLNPLYEKFCLSTYLVDMLMSFTFVKFAEDDGLPAKICTNCINEINQAFSFAKRCETTDTILRKCVKIKTEFANNWCDSQKVRPVEIKPEMLRKADEVLQNFETVQIKQEGGVKIEYTDVRHKDSMYQPTQKMLNENEYTEKNVKVEYVEVEQDGDARLENEHDETYDHLADNSYEEDVHEDETEETRKDDIIKNNKSLLKLPNKILSGNFKCTLCNRLFARSSHLKYHIRIHTGEKPNICFVCSEAFTHSISLKNHMRIHTGEKKPYSCETCNKSFNRSTHLKYHMRIHTGEKPNICSVCSKAFTHSTSLKNHMRLHTGEKPYMCKICNKTFNRPEILKNHMRIHTGEKPNICPTCNKAFAHRLTLRYHMRIHTGEKPYSCESCGKSFTTNGALTVHKRTHTKETDEMTTNKM